MAKLLLGIRREGSTGSASECGEPHCVMAHEEGNSAEPMLVGELSVIM